MRELAAGDVRTWVREVLLDPGRTRPVVAVTTLLNSDRTWIDPGQLDAALEGRADVVRLQTGDPTWELAAALPARLDVYGGAIRIWWPGLRADSNPHDHRLFFVHSPVEARNVFLRIVETLRGTGTAGALPAVVEATVASIDGNAILLAAGDHSGPLQFTDLPLADLARCLTVGMTLRARVVRPQADGTCAFTVQGLLPSPWERALAELAVGDVVTGRVQNVVDFGAFVDLLPRVAGLVHKSEIDWTFVASIGEFVRRGDLVRVKILAFDRDRRRLELSIKRALGSDPRPLPSLVPGGLPFHWPAEPPAPAAGGEQAELRGEHEERLQELADELDAAVQDRAQLMEQNKLLREQVIELKRELRAADDRLAARERKYAAELDPLSGERAFLLGVRLAYARMFDEADRTRQPLRRMRVGPAFLDSLRDLDGIEVEKVLEVCAQVASGLAHTIPAREVHQLRDGSRGAGSRVRETDRAQAWRCALQVNTPSARRLHWWSVPGPDGGVIEFASVGLHDDFAIPG